MARVRVKKALALNTFGDSRAIKVLWEAFNSKGRQVGRKVLMMHIGRFDSVYEIDVGGKEAVAVKATVLEELLPQNVQFEWDVP